MPNDTKACCTCGTIKPFEDFNRHARSKDGRQPTCRECQRSKRVGWYEANREREIAKSREWNLANPERVRANDAARDPEKRRRNNRETYGRNGHKYRAAMHERRASDLDAFRERERQWRAVSKESIAERKRAYREVNPNVRIQERANGLRRHAATKGGPGGMDLLAKFDYYGGLCWICGDNASAMDHVKPLAAGGSHILANLRPACTPCNSRKRARWYGVERLDELTGWVLLRLAV